MKASKTQRLEPRPYQVEGLKKIANYLAEAYRCGEFAPAFVEYSVGYGKTGIYAFLARHATKNNIERICNGIEPFRVLVIAHQAELVKQNSEFATAAGVPNTVISADLNKGQTLDPSKFEDVIFATDKTLINRIDAGLFEDWQPDLIMVDECHRLDWKDFVKWNKGHNKPDDKPTVYTRILNFFVNRQPDFIQLIGGSGSPWRDNEWIKGPFWKECIDRKDTADLIKEKFLVPVRWGASKDEYNFASMKYDIDTVGDKDINLDEAQKLTSKNLSKTKEICQEVVGLTKKRKGVLIFCSGHDHLSEVKQGLIDAGANESDIGVITEGTGFKSRTDILDRARDGKCKFVLNVSVLTTGVNVPRWDTVVFMRPIGSVVLFTQAVGRVLRTDAKKSHALALDYAGCFERLGSLSGTLSGTESNYKKEKESTEFRICPNCHDQISVGKKVCGCGYDFGEPKVCVGYGNTIGCNHINKSTALRCASCHSPLMDVNQKLSKNHYRKFEFSEVQSLGFYPANKGRSKCSVKIIIHMKDGRVFRHKFYSPKQLKDFAESCNISDEYRAELSKKYGPQVDSFILKTWKDEIYPHAFATQRENQPPRMMSAETYYEQD